MALINENEVVPFERFRGYGLVAPFITKLVDVYYLNASAPEEVSLPLILVEDLGRDPGCLEFQPVVLREPFVGGEEQNAVQFAIAAVALQIVLLLEDIGVQQQRLARARRAPECDLVEL